MWQACRIFISGYTRRLWSSLNSLSMSFALYNGVIQEQHGCFLLSFSSSLLGGVGWVKVQGRVDKRACRDSTEAQWLPHWLFILVVDVCPAAWPRLIQLKGWLCHRSGIQMHPVCLHAAGWKWTCRGKCDRLCSALSVSTKGGGGDSEVRTFLGWCRNDNLQCSVKSAHILPFPSSPSRSLGNRNEIQSLSLSLLPSFALWHWLCQLLCPRVLTCTETGGTWTGATLTKACSPQSSGLVCGCSLSVFYISMVSRSHTSKLCRQLKKFSLPSFFMFSSVVVPLLPQ